MAQDKKDIQQTLLDIRKAHRLIYAYQRRMLDIVTFIRQSFDLNKDFSFEKRFSDSIGSEISFENWAWDFLYSYMCEYFIGKHDTADGKRSYAFSVVQYADTGYFENDNANELDLSSFASESQSGTKLLFHLESAPLSLDKNGWEYWSGKRNEFFRTPIYASKDFDRVVLQPDGMKDYYVVLYSVPIEKLMGEESTKEVLRDFVQYCNTNAKTDLKLLF